MDNEYWKSSPFGENSLFSPKWDEKKSLSIENKSKHIRDIEYVYDNNGQSSNKKIDGYCYLEDGTFVGKYGASPYVIICSKKEENNGKITFDILLETEVKYQDLLLVAATAVGESSYGYQVSNKFEVYALANAIINFYEKENLSKGLIKDSIYKMKAYAAIKRNDIFCNFMSQTDVERNDNFFKEAICGAINAMCINYIDYSNGATHWDGIDIKKAGKWKEGLYFQNKRADIFSIGSNRVHTEIMYADKTCFEKIFNYKWIGVSGYYGINKNKNNPYCPYYDGDTFNKHKFGTVFMKLSDEYKNRIKYGEHKVN